MLYCKLFHLDSRHALIIVYSFIFLFIFFFQLLIIFISGSNLRINKILLIPILFIVCRIWGTIQRLSCYCFLSHLDSVCTSHILIALLNFFDPLQGFVNFLLFTILSQNNCRCDCLTIVRANIQRPQHLTSAEPVTVYVQRESSDSSQF